MNLFQSATVCAAALALTGCSTSIDEYQNTSPKFDLKQYFSGDVTAWGIVQDYSQKTVRRFCVDIVGTWQGDTGQLHETFYYADGETQIRVWQLSIQQDGSVTGSAGDVIGQASGSASGMSFNWHYTLRVPIDDSEYDLKVDDWMFMMDDNRMMNRSYMSKLGIGVAEISIFFDKTPPIRKCQ
ncbi:DUF3833 domain-containing protein [Aliiglaciecola sp. 3_MG-2023]|uniref:DUF3833 domain-containing protein n=1 Tax=Aliiglaciecola sp. 3_MG-2023 TaxID=3062644 RepID=UPI0026E3C047|nr:DUF3833 domain-containing protein [Aliiglaciecola sp. 3_MG-2023]MDO6693954.1 DUF3833 domain-containing protein [Aliiglaciecola sp. 3_MG-2023]